MNNNYNNGQFGGWGQNQYGAGNVPDYSYFNEQYKKEQEKKQDKKVIKTMGLWFGLAILGYVAIANLASLLVYLLYSTIMPKIEILYSDFIMMDAYQIVASVLFILVPFAVSYFVLKKKKIAGTMPMGTTYNTKAAVSLAMLILPVMLFSTVIINLASSVIQEMLGVTFVSGMEDFKVLGIKGFIMSTFSTAVLPAVIEEIVIRGIVMQPLRRFGDKFAIVSSALIFSLMHGNMVQVPYTMVVGILFGYLVIKTGSLWPAIVLHFVNNFYSVVLYAVYDNFGDTYGALATVLFFVVFIIVGIIGGVSYSKMNYRMPMKDGVKTLSLGEKITALFVNVPMIIAIIMLVSETVSSIE